MATVKQIEPETTVVAPKAQVELNLSTPFNLRVKQANGSFKTYPLRAGFNSIDAEVTEAPEFSFVKRLLMPIAKASSTSPTRASSIPGSQVPIQHGPNQVGASAAALAAQENLAREKAELTAAERDVAQRQAKAEMDALAAKKAEPAKTTEPATAADHAKEAAAVADLNKTPAEKATEGQEKATAATLQPDVKAKLAAATTLDK